MKSSLDGVRTWRYRQVRLLSSDDGQWEPATRWTSVRRSCRDIRGARYVLSQVWSLRFGSIFSSVTVPVGSSNRRRRDFNFFIVCLEDYFWQDSRGQCNLYLIWFSYASCLITFMFTVWYLNNGFCVIFSILKGNCVVFTCIAFISTLSKCRPVAFLSSPLPSSCCFFALFFLVCQGSRHLSFLLSSFYLSRAFCSINLSFYQCQLLTMVSPILWLIDTQTMVLLCSSTDPGSLTTHRRCKSQRFFYNPLIEFFECSTLCFDISVWVSPLPPFSRVPTHLSSVTGDSWPPWHLRALPLEFTAFPFPSDLCPEKTKSPLLSSRPIWSNLSCSPSKSSLGVW